MASRMPSLGVIPGYALDLTTDDAETGEPWDLNQASKRRKALDMIRRQQPLWVIGSAMRTA